MSSPYPVLNNKTIDQLKVTELKEELKRRKLPVRGLKDELVRRLADAMNAEIMDIEEKVDDEVKKDEPKVEDQSDSVQVQTENYEVDNVPTDNKVKDPDEQDDFSNAAMVDKDANSANIVKDGICDGHTKVGRAERDAATEATSEVTNKDINKDLKVEDARTVSSGLEVSISETEANLIFLEDGATESHTATLQHDSDAVITRSEEKLDEPVQGNSNLPREEISPESHNQVSVVSLDLGSQVKCESIPIDSVSIIEKNKLKDNLNADDFHLEKEVVKQEMVQPSSNIVPSLGGDLQTLHDAKEQVKHLISMEDTNIKKSIFVDDGKKEDNLDEESPEKLNLDRSSSDELMEDDVLESKNIDSNIKTEELVEKTVVIQELIVSDIKKFDVKQDGSIMEEIIDEDIKKPTVLPEKRKLEDQEVVAINEVPKRQRRWNSDAVKIPERQLSNLSTSSTPKNTFEVTPRRIFMKSDLKSPGDSQKERIVPPSQKPATTSLRIDRFLRPFTLKAVQELLAKTGTVCSFWMDHIKTHCYVTYSSLEEATATRNAVYNLQWPPNGGNLLVAEFVDPQEVKARAEAPPPSPASITSNPNTPKAANFQQPQAAQPPVRQHSLKQHQLPLPMQRQPDLQPVREQLPPPPPPGEPDPPALTLDDLFKKTKATPRIYYLPLSEEEAASKLAAHGKSIKN